jgi:hypothetical protein
MKTLSILSLLAFSTVSNAASSPLVEAQDLYQDAVLRARCRLENTTCKCARPAGKDQILSLLEDSFQKDPSLKQRALIDPKLEPIRDTVTFQLWRGKTLETSDDIGFIIPQVSWWLSDQSLKDLQLHFKPDGSYVIENGITGVYTIEERTIDLTTASKPQKKNYPQSGRMSVVPGKSYEYLLNGAKKNKSPVPFSDIPIDCKETEKKKS